MKHAWFFKLTAVLMALCVLGPSHLLGQLSFEDLGVRIIPKNSYYEITEVAESANPGFLVFGVQAVHADYRVEGVLPLMKLLHEIEAIEKIRRNEDTSGFMDGMASSVESTGDGFIKLVKNPVESGKGLGKAVERLGGAIGGFFRDKEEGEKASFGDSFVGAAERELAKNYNVDVYTANPYLKKMLKSMAKSRVGGKGVAAVASFLIPVAGIAGLAITASSVNGAADKLVNDSSKGELFQVNKEGLSKMGFSSALVSQFLNSPYYTPREATYVRVYLERLQRTPGFREILPVAADLKNSLDIKKLLYAMQIAAEKAQEDPYIFDSVQIRGDGLWAAAEKNVIWILPYDYLDNNSHGKFLLEQAVEEWKLDPKRGLEIWTAGQVTQDFLRAASARGVKLQWYKLWGGAKASAQI